MSSLKPPEVAAIFRVGADLATTYIVLTDFVIDRTTLYLDTGWLVAPDPRRHGGFSWTQLQVDGDLLAKVSTELEWSQVPAEVQRYIHHQLAMMAKPL